MVNKSSDGGGSTCCRCIHHACPLKVFREGEMWMYILIYFLSMHAFEESLLSVSPSKTTLTMVEDLVLYMLSAMSLALAAYAAMTCLQTSRVGHSLVHAWEKYPA